MVFLAYVLIYILLGIILSFIMHTKIKTIFCIEELTMIIFMYPIIILAVVLSAVGVFVIYICLEVFTNQYENEEQRIKNSRLHRLMRKFYP